ncbi:hypothetical protein [Streptomyces sp. H39-C1]|nr:hypothetical protein [Streptomyces sp. H39-C1]MCZ4099978.1 hypothetical protein [Streptomyces sp. H39-C1]
MDRAAFCGDSPSGPRRKTDRTSISPVNEAKNATATRIPPV